MINLSKIESMCLFRALLSHCVRCQNIAQEEYKKQQPEHADVMNREAAMSMALHDILSSGGNYEITDDDNLLMCRALKAYATRTLDEAGRCMAANALASAEGKRKEGTFALKIAARLEGNSTN